MADKLEAQRFVSLTEVEKVQNPAFCAFLIWKYGRAYQATLSSEASNFIIPFLILPICLHKPTLDIVSTTRISSGLGKFCEKLSSKREELLAVHERAYLLRSLTLNSIGFGIRANLLSVNYEQGLLRSFEHQPPKLPERLKKHEKSAEKLGSWFAQLSSAQISKLLKVEF